jgi:predicted membrane protein
MRPDHFTAVLLFALCVSTVFGITMRDTPRKMLRYGLYCFAMFVGAAILLSWIMLFVAR